MNCETGLLMSSLEGGRRLNGLLKVILIHMFLRLKSRMSGVVSLNCSCARMFSSIQLANEVWLVACKHWVCGTYHRMPIMVYPYDEEAGGLIAIAEYGKAYAKANPVRVLYHGGHYEALQIPGNKGFTSRSEDLDHIV